MFCPILIRMDVEFYYSVSYEQSPYSINFNFILRIKIKLKFILTVRPWFICNKVIQLLARLSLNRGKLMLLARR